MVMLQLKFNAESFVNRFYDDDQEGWLKDGDEKLKSMIEKYLDDHNFEDYKIDLDKVIVRVGCVRPSYNDPNGDFNLDIEGEVEVDIYE